MFTAVAEDTEDAYNDGARLGAAIGVTTRDGTVHFLERLNACPRVGAIAARVDNNVIRLLLVTDADDRTIPANLYDATLPNSAIYKFANHLNQFSRCAHKMSVAGS